MTLDEIIEAIGVKPFYQEPAGVIYCADCLDILPRIPDKAIDLVLTDPPYGMKFVSNHRTIKYDPIVGDDRFPIEILLELIQMSQCATYIFCRWNNLINLELPKPKSVIAWVKNGSGMGDLDHEHGRAWEACLFYNGLNHKFIKRIPDVLWADRTGNNWHPTEKPVNLLMKLISCNNGDLILDPFAGSGTTGVAAKQLGRKFILCEIEETYCAIAVERLRQEVLAI